MLLSFFFRGFLYTGEIDMSLDPTIGMLGVIAIGLALGRLSVFGISFGTSAILFVALLAGHWGLEAFDGLGTLGLALFVFCVGISAGPTFFRGLAARGRAMAMLGGWIVLSGLGTTVLVAWLFSLPSELAGGLMAGAMTSTPALGAITQTAIDAPSVAVGFGVAYPIGILAVVLFVQLMLKFGGGNGVYESTTVTEDASLQSKAIQRQVVEFANPGLVGRRPGAIEILVDSSCQISRIRIEGRWRPLPSEYQFSIGDHLLLVGNETDIRRVAETLGQVRNDEVVLDADRERKIVVVTSPAIYGHSLKELSMRSRLGVTVVRIRRHELEFVPSGRTLIEFGDTLTLVGEASSLMNIENVFGHRPRALNETDLLSLVGGITVGILVGQIAFQFGTVSMSLGVAGGPLAVGLVLGHFRRIGPIRGSFPPAAQLLLTEGGLAIFIADAGLKAGAAMGDVLAEHGLPLAIAASAIAIVPMVLGYSIAKFWFKLDLLASLGATCGGMTSTPGLAVLTDASSSSQSVTSYVAAYPVALVMVTIMAPPLVQLLAWLNP